MNPTVVLDPSKENTIQEGYICIKTEIDFLRSDYTESLLWIQGRSLCHWVNDIYRVRGLKENVHFHILTSPRERLWDLIGDKASNLDSDTLRAALECLDAEPKLGLGALLSRLTGEDFWCEAPSAKHAARWLLGQFDKLLYPLIEVQSQSWVKECTNDALKSVYRAPITERRNHLRAWLGTDNALGLGAFPVRIEGQAVEIIHDVWGALLRESQGRAVAHLSSKNPNANHIAFAAYEYFKHHLEFLTPAIVAQIGPLLSTTKRAFLEERIPKPQPQLLSIDAPIETVLAWATQEYLPYRHWQVLAAPDQEPVAEQLGNSFGQWILNNYPRLTTYSREHSPLNIRGRYEVERLMERRTVLWVVVDGLNYINHHRLLRLLARTDAELRVEQNLELLTVLPTVTRQAKYALTSGLFPRENAKGEWSIQRVFSSLFPNGKYAGETQLDRLQAGLADASVRVCYWNMTAVDACYHKQTDPAAILRNVEAQLEALAKHISSLLMQALHPERIAVVIATDHGQMIGPCVKSTPFAESPEVHGRTLYKSLQGDEGQIGEGYRISSDDSMAELNSIRFQLDTTTTIALGRRYFGGWPPDAEGRAWGVHGGIYPEEVVIGFSVLSRNPNRKLIKATLSGTGEAGKPGILTLKIDNPNPSSITLLSILINEIAELGFGMSLLDTIRAADAKAIEVLVERFPAPAEGDSLEITGSILYEFEDGISCEGEVNGKLTCKQIYSGQRPSLRDRFKK